MNRPHPGGLAPAEVRLLPTDRCENDSKYKEENGMFIRVYSFVNRDGHTCRHFVCHTHYQSYLSIQHERCSLFVCPINTGREAAELIWVGERSVHAAFRGSVTGWIHHKPPALGLVCQILLDETRVRARHSLGWRCIAVFRRPPASWPSSLVSISK